jgi:hypothetical protein
VYTLADFFPNWNFRGVFLHIINFAVRISEAAMKGVEDIIFHKPGGRVHPHAVIFRGFFSILFAARSSEAAMGGAEVGGHNMIQ